MAMLVIARWSYLNTYIQQWYINLYCYVSVKKLILVVNTWRYYENATLALISNVSTRSSRGPADSERLDDPFDGIGWLVVTGDRNHGLVWDNDG